jgi:acyl-CoA thioesterase-1
MGSPPVETMSSLVWKTLQTLAALYIILLAAQPAGLAAAAPDQPEQGDAMAAEPLTVLALGDSLTAGWGVPHDASVPERLERMLRADGIAARVVNAGVSGDTTQGGLARLQWALAEEPDAAIVELGANDMLRGLHPRTAKENLAAILEALRSRNIPTLLAGMLAPPNMGQIYSRGFNAIYTDLAREYDVVFYPFYLQDVAGRPDLNQEDGLHPNAEGYAVIAENIYPYVLELVERARRQE